MHDIGAWESFLGRALGLPVVLAFVTDLDPSTTWSPAERQLADSFESSLRRETWLRGRSALKLVLSRLGEDTDTSPILFPTPRYSLSHCAHAAVAVGLPEGTPVEGIGVDIELHRMPPEQSARFFLTDRESSWISGIQEKDIHLVRLWTVKEALFKADPGNAGHTMAGYGLDDPSLHTGRALSPRQAALDYASLLIPGGVLSIAVLPIATLR